MSYDEQIEDGVQSRVTLVFDEAAKNKRLFIGAVILILPVILGDMVLYRVNETERGVLLRNGALVDVKSV